MYIEPAPKLGVPPTTVEIDPDLRQAVEDYTRALVEFQETAERLDALQRSREDALQADARATADARRSGAKNPGDKHERKRLAALAEEERQFRASRLILSEASDKLRTLATDRRPAELERLRDALGTDREEFERAMASVADVIERVNGRLAYRYWLAKIGEGGPVFWGKGAAVPIPPAAPSFDALGRAIDPLRLVG